MPQPDMRINEEEKNTLSNDNLAQNNAIAQSWHISNGITAKNNVSCSSYQASGFSITFETAIRQMNEAKVHASDGPVKIEA